VKGALCRAAGLLNLGENSITPPAEGRVNLPTSFPGYLPSSPFPRGPGPHRP